MTRVTSPWNANPQIEHEPGVLRVCGRGSPLGDPNWQLFLRDVPFRL